MSVVMETVSAFRLVTTKLKLRLSNLLNDLKCNVMTTDRICPSAKGAGLHLPLTNQSRAQSNINDTFILF